MEKRRMGWDKSETIIGRNASSEGRQIPRISRQVNDST